MDRTRSGLLWRWALVWLLFLVQCTGEAENINLLILIENAPADGTLMTVSATLDGKQAMMPFEIRTSLSRYGVQLPKDAQGHLVLRMQVTDGAQCVLAEGELAQELGTGERQQTLNTRLTTLQPRRCPPPPMPMTCSPLAFCFVTPQPSGNTIRGVWAVSNNDVWAVGDVGSIAHYDGSKWTAIKSGVQSDLHSVWASGPSEVIVVGAGGKVLRGTTAGFAEMTSGTTTALHGVWGVGAGGDVWAVGAGGTVLRLNRGTNQWMPVLSATSESLYGVWGSGANRVYAVGDKGVISRFNGTVWMMENVVGTMANLRGISGDASRVVAVGEGGTVVQNTGAVAWAGLASGVTDTLRAALVSGTATWVVGDKGARLRSMGGALAQEPTISDGITSGFYAVTGTSATNVWIGGEGGRLMNYDGTAWGEKTSGGRQAIRSMFGFNTQDLWAVGDEGLAMHYDGKAWTATASGTTETLHSVWGSSSKEVWAVGNNRTMIRWDGTSWTVRAFPGNADRLTNLRAIWGTNTGNFVVSGESNQVAAAHVLISVGGVNRVLFINPGEDLPAYVTIWGQSTDDFWIAGNSRIEHLIGNGGSYSTFRYTPAIDVQAMWGSRGTDVLAVGAGGQIVRYDGTAFRVVASGTTETLRGIYGLSDEDIWIVGDKGTLLRPMGSSFVPKDSGTTNPLHTVWGAAAGDFWAGGTFGSILHTVK